jgi:hypothetical protein
MGVTMARAFQCVIERYNIADKILGVIADNASANDMMTRKLGRFNNPFKKEYHAQCFNHMLQLSAKTLLRPFNTALSRKVADDDDTSEDEEEDLPIRVLDEEFEEEEEWQGNEDDDGIDELDMLSEVECYE